MEEFKAKIWFGVILSSCLLNDNAFLTCEFYIDFYISNSNTIFIIGQYGPKPN